MNAVGQSTLGYPAILASELYEVVAVRERLKRLHPDPTSPEPTKEPDNGLQ